MGTHQDVLLGLYIPPPNSPYYKDPDIYNGIAILEDCILEVSKQLGDLNARTKSENVRTVDDVTVTLDYGVDDDSGIDQKCVPNFM